LDKITIVEYGALLKNPYFGDGLLMLTEKRPRIVKLINSESE
jgi:hypothetical protein